MITYDIKERQDKLLEILSVIDKVCQEHHLRYYIVGGTMLGAFRHGGFIPWDDDMDVGLPRADYEQLIAHAHEWFPEQYEFICGEKDTNYPHAFGKIQDAHTTFIERRAVLYVGGINVDIFSIDGVPNGKVARKIHFAKYKFYERMLYFLFRDPYKHGKGIRSWWALLCRKLTTRAKIHAACRQLLMKYDFDKQPLVAIFDDGSKKFVDKNIFGTPTPILFCGKKMLGVEQPEAYLKRTYGDYMTVPKPEKRKIHGCFYLNFNLPYKEYKL